MGHIQHYCKNPKVQESVLQKGSKKLARTGRQEPLSVQISRPLPYQLKLMPGLSWFLPARVNGIRIDMLVDTGAECTLIHKLKWEEIAKTDSEQYKLSPSGALELADGSGMEVAGEFVGSLYIGGQTYTGRIIVANIGNLSGVLGLNFLEKINAKIDLQHGELELPGHTVIMHKLKAPEYCRIAVVEKCEIPPGDEVMVKGLVRGIHSKSKLGVTPSIGAVEGQGSLGKRGLRVAKSVVSPFEGYIPLSVINLSDGIVTLQEGETVGRLFPIEEIVEVTDKATAFDAARVERKLPDHIQPLVDACKDDLSFEQLQELSDFLGDHQSMFASPDGKLGVTSLVDHAIDVGNAKPIKQAPYRPPFAKRKVAEKEMERMLAQGVIEPSSSPWASPVVLVTKKDGSIRFCVDFRKVNGVTVKDAYPLPRIVDCLDTLGGARWFCTLDLASGYWQVPMKEGDKEKTAFTTGTGLYQFTVMPFGLSNAPANFERLMERVLSGLQWHQCLVYLDDIIIFGSDFDETLGNLKMVFERLQSANLTLKAKKCSFFKREYVSSGMLCLLKE